MAIAPDPILDQATQPEPGSALLRVWQLDVRLGGRRVVEEVSFDVARHEVAGIIGPNGSGKTTVLRAAAGLLSPSSGRVELLGADLSQLDSRARARRIAYLPQSAGHGTAFTSMEIALMGRYPHLGKFELESSRDRRIAHDALRKTGVLRFADRQIGDMSGGERQRVFIARALAQQPELLLLDEPTTSLDLKHQLALMTLVAGEARAGVGTLVVMHDLSLAARFCDRLLLMNEGALVADGMPREVLTPANLSRVFEVDAEVSIDQSAGKPYIRLIGDQPRD